MTVCAAFGSTNHICWLSVFRCTVRQSV